MPMQVNYYDEDSGLYIMSAEDVQTEIWLNNVLERIAKGDPLNPKMRERLICEGYDPNTGDYMNDDDMSPVDLRELED